jgi:hypothetical protein
VLISILETSPPHCGVIDRHRHLNISIAGGHRGSLSDHRVLTFDHRHFRAVAPLWGAAAFSLLPADGTVR